MKSSLSTRVRIIFVLIFACSLVLVGKLYFLQIVHGDQFTVLAEGQYSGTTETTFNRGIIYFQNKNGTLMAAATLKEGADIALNPTLLKDPENVYKAINGITPINYASFITKASKKNDPYEELLKKIPLEIGKKIADLKITGVEVVKSKWRFYPGEKMGAHVLGLVGFKDDVLAGRYGLESSYDDVLKRGGGEVFVNFFAEIFSGIKKSISGEKREGDIITSIEPTVELFLEQELASIQKKWNPEFAGGIIINPMTGEIYAMAQSPTFDPNKFQTEKSSDIFSNKLIEGVYEMGSIMKPLTLASAMDVGKITAETTYDDKGFLVLNNSRLENFDGRGRGVVSMQEVLNQSLNTGAAFSALTMGKENFSKYFLNFGFGEKTGIDLPNETSGLIGNLKSPRDIEFANMAFGQGIAVTPIEMVRALSAMANGGTLVTPHLAKEIDYKLGFSEEAISKGLTKKVLKKETSTEITRMLVEVVDKALKNGKAKIPGYSVAAKTGTAQLPNKEKGYYKDKYLHSFFGYFPAYNPKFLVFLIAKDPKGVTYASDTLADSFLSITKFLMNYYEIPPDR